MQRYEWRIILRPRSPDCGCAVGRSTLLLLRQELDEAMRLAITPKLTGEIPASHPLSQRTRKKDGAPAVLLNGRGSLQTLFHHKQISRQGRTQQGCNDGD